MTCHHVQVYQEAGSLVQAHKVHSDIEIFVGCKPAKVGESSDMTSIVNSAVENNSNFCEDLDGKPLVSAFYCM
jgi:hypothetical protein